MITTEQVIDVTQILRDAPADLGIKLDEGLPAYSSTSRPVRRRNQVGLIKAIRTALAMSWNLVLIYPLMSVVASTLHDQARTRQVGGGMELVRDGGKWELQPEGTSSMTTGTALLLAFHAASFPFLGAFVTNAKRRGMAEGYVLVTFFSCLGLIVALALPTEIETA